MYELSLVELESELSAELPARTLMSRRKMKYGFHPNSSAHANNGSVANGNSTNQVIFNPQIAIITGVNTGGAGLQANGALIAQAGLDSNANTNTQFGVPVNFLG